MFQINTFFRHGLLGLAILLLVSTVVVGQTKVKPNEPVQVLVSGEWYSGVVVEKGKRQQIKVVVDANGETETVVVGRPQIRKLNEVDAVDYERIWTSSSGKNTTRAALKSYDGTNVVLIKSDMGEVVVPIDRLSVQDKTYAKKYLGQGGGGSGSGVIRSSGGNTGNRSNSGSDGTGSGTPQAGDLVIQTLNSVTPWEVPELPEAEEFDNRFDYEDINQFSWEKMASTPVKPLGATPDSLLTLKETGVAFRFVRDVQELESLVYVGGEKQWVLVNSSEQHEMTRSEKMQSQFYWISLADQKVIAVGALPHYESILDYQIDSNLMLTFDSGTRRGFSTDPDSPISGSYPHRLTVWKLDPGGETAEPIARWIADSIDTHSRMLPFAKFVNDHMVITRDSHPSNCYSGWDFVKQEVVYRTSGGIFGSKNSTKLTENRKYLLLISKRQIGMMDAETGRFKMAVNADRDDAEAYGGGPVKLRAGSTIDCVDLNSSGTRLAAIIENFIYIWDLELADPAPLVYRIGANTAGFDDRIEWVDDESVVFWGFHELYYFSLKYGIPIWKYESEQSARGGFGQRHLHYDFIDKMFVYYVRPMAISGPSPIAVGAVQFPGPEVQEVVDSLDLKTSMAVMPGTHVALNLVNVLDPEIVEKVLKAKIEANGWIEDAKAKVVIDARMGTIDPSGKFKDIGDPNGNAVRNKFQNNHVMLRVFKNGTICFEERMTVINSDGLDHGAETKFFRDRVLPRQIPDAKFKRGFGTSVVGGRGIQVIKKNSLK